MNVLEELFNHYLSLDPSMQKRLKPFVGKVLKITANGFPFSFYLVNTPEKIEVCRSYEGAVDAHLCGDLFGLIQLGLGNDAGKTQQLFKEQVTIEGDIEFAQAFKKVFDEMDIDWEEQLSKIIGDIAAHQITSTWEQACSWLKQSHQAMQQNVSEYLHEEARYIIGEEELQDFYTDIARIRDDVERLSLKVAALKE